MLWWRILYFSTACIGLCGVELIWTVVELTCTGRVGSIESCGHGRSCRRIVQSTCWRSWCRQTCQLRGCVAGHTVKGFSQISSSFQNNLLFRSKSWKCFFLSFFSIFSSLTFGNFSGSPGCLGISFANLKNPWSMVGSFNAININKH